jgi:hypothetical protein
VFELYTHLVCWDGVSLTSCWNCQSSQSLPQVAGIIGMNYHTWQYALKKNNIFGTILHFSVYLYDIFLFNSLFWNIRFTEVILPCHRLYGSTIPLWLVMFSCYCFYPPPTPRIFVDFNGLLFWCVKVISWNSVVVLGIRAMWKLGSEEYHSLSLLPLPFLLLSS